MKKLLVLLFITGLIFIAFPVNEPKGEIIFSYGPVAEFSCFPPSGSAPLTVQFFNNSRWADTFQWSFGDSGTSADISPSHTFTKPGYYIVTLTAKQEKRYSSMSLEVVVTAGAPPDVEFIGRSVAPPIGQEVNFINLTPGTFTKYLWDFGDGTSATVADPTHTYETPGFYTVSLFLFDGSNLYYETKPNYIYVYEPSASLLKTDFIANPVSGTPPHTVQFTNLTGGSVQDILWNFGDGTESNELNPKHTYSEPGLYNVTLLVNGEEVKKTSFINILPSPQDKRCPAAVLLNDDEAALAILQDFQEKVLSNSLLGQGLMELYYKYSLELTSIFLNNESLQEEAGNLLRELLPGFKSIVEGGTMTITNAQLDQIKVLIGKIASQASPELGDFLANFVLGLIKGNLFGSIGISVAGS